MPVVTSLKWVSDVAVTLSRQMFGMSKLRTTVTNEPNSAWPSSKPQPLDNPLMRAVARPANSKREARTTRTAWSCEQTVSEISIAALGLPIHSSSHQVGIAFVGVACCIRIDLSIGIGTMIILTTNLWRQPSHSLLFSSLLFVGWTFLVLFGWHLGDTALGMVVLRSHCYKKDALE